MIIDEEDYLEHFGVKGMRWGVRNEERPGGVSRKIDRMARKDAEEAARAKAFYGEGAGTRRKLIKQTVEGKTKRIPGYKQAFDHHLDNQDTSKHASKAVSERKRKDTAGRTKQRLGYAARRITGEPGTQAAFAAAVVGGAAYLNSPKGRQKLNRAVSFVKNQHAELIRKNGARAIQRLLKKQGL
jgi:hypothetical protein